MKTRHSFKSTAPSLAALGYLPGASHLNGPFSFSGHHYKYLSPSLRHCFVVLKVEGNFQGRLLFPVPPCYSNIYGDLKASVSFSSLFSSISPLMSHESSSFICLFLGARGPPHSRDSSRGRMIDGKLSAVVYVSLLLCSGFSPSSSLRSNETGASGRPGGVREGVSALP